MNQRLDSIALTSGLSKLHGWSGDTTKISKTFSFDNYYQSIAFVNGVAMLAHKANHHPDMNVHFSKVVVSLSTHDSSGVSEKDVELASKIELLMSI